MNNKEKIEKIKFLLSRTFNVDITVLSVFTNNLNDLQQSELINGLMEILQDEEKANLSK